MTDLVIRPLQPGEEALFDSYQLPAGYRPDIYVRRSFTDRLASGEFRIESTWVALRGGTVVARASWWWASKDDDAPADLFWFDCDDVETGAALLQAPGYHLEYELMLPPGWRDDPAVRPEAQRRIDAATAAGLRVVVERWSYRWTADLGLPPRPGRLEFRPEPDDGVWLDVLRRITVGTLDAHARHEIEKSGIDGAAQADLDILRWFPSPREWWRLAYTKDGALVGLTVPARNLVMPVVGLIAVVPEQRGNGYGYDLLVECTHLLAEAGCDEVIGATDQTNFPMAAAFDRAGYRTDGERVCMI